MAIGIASLSVVLSSVSGFENKVFDKLSNINGYSTINNLFEDTFNKSDVPLPDVVQDNKPLILEYIERPAIIKSKYNSNNVIIYGLGENDVTHFSLFQDINYEEFSINDIIIGKELANKLKVQEGDSLILINPLSSKSVLSNEKFLFLKIRNIYSSGIYDYDSRLVFMPDRKSVV